MARIAGRLVEGPVADRAFLAGMLHDVGKVVLATREPEAYGRIADRDAESTLRAAEEEKHAPPHDMLGAYLLGIWGIPFDVVEAVGFHHFPSRLGHEELDGLGAVHIADCLANEVVGLPFRFDATYVELIGIAERLDDLREIAQQELESLEREVAA